MDVPFALIVIGAILLLTAFLWVYRRQMHGGAKEISVPIHPVSDASHANPSRATNLRQADQTDMSVGPARTAHRDLTQEEAVEVTRLANDGLKINAIKLVRERTGMGLAAAKDYVEKIEQVDSSTAIDINPSFHSAEAGEGDGFGQERRGLSPEQQRKIIQLVNADKKIIAISQMREWTGLGLSESKELVEILADINQAGSTLH